MREGSFSKWTSNNLGGQSARPPQTPTSVAKEIGVLPPKTAELPLKPEPNEPAVPTSGFPAKFPKLIWQTASQDGIERWANKTTTWKEKNPGWKYNLLTDAGATAFVYEQFRNRPAVTSMWTDLQQPVLRADFIRYLAILARGGVYSDVDTSDLVPVDEWIPAEFHDKAVNAIVGVEYDDNTYHMFVRPISFCQWTLMAKPGHPIFESAVSRLMSNLDYIARRKRSRLDDLKLEKAEVLEATGPGMFTDAVMEVLKDQVEHIRWSTFHNLKKPKLFGDVLVLPVRAFAGGQRHSHSTNPKYGRELVKHHFGRSWYRPQAPFHSPEQGQGIDDEKAPDGPGDAADQSPLQELGKDHIGDSTPEKSTDNSDPIAQDGEMDSKDVGALHVTESDAEKSDESVDSVKTEETAPETTKEDEENTSEDNLSEIPGERVNNAQAPADTIEEIPTADVEEDKLGQIPGSGNGPTAADSATDQHEGGRVEDDDPNDPFILPDA